MASKFGGYAGKVIQIDLTTETVKEYPWTDRQRQLYLGGKIMANRILADHLTGTESAFSEENWVILSTGPLTGTGAPGSVRFDITALSPKTNIPTSSNCGGNFGLYLKKAGYDALILSGCSRVHRWLEISEERIQFHDADDLWGKGTTECRQLLTGLLNYNSYSSLCIGPVGEELIPSATVISDDRAAGRAGLGAVLGWKNLKAITVTEAITPIEGFGSSIFDRKVRKAPDFFRNPVLFYGIFFATIKGKRNAKLLSVALIINTSGNSKYFFLCLLSSIHRMPPACEALPPQNSGSAPDTVPGSPAW